MGNTFRNVRTKARTPPKVWRERKRKNRKNADTYAARLALMYKEHDIAAENGNKARREKFQRLIDKTHVKLERISV